MNELYVYDIANIPQKEFRNNKIISLTNKNKFTNCSKDVLENIISVLSEIIKSL